jgi:hypothetical protein
VTAPGPPKAIGKGAFSNGFLAMLATERFVAGRSQNSLVAGLARHGAGISAATMTGALAQAGNLLAALAEAIISRSGASWHLHADETSWQVLAPRAGNGPARWWLWAFIGPDTTAFTWTPPGPVRCWPVMPASTRRPGSSLPARTRDRDGW